MKALEKTLKRAVGEDNRQLMLYTLLCGLVCHGVMLFNKLSWHDDLNHGFFLLIEKPVAMGRWMRAFLGYVVARAFGGYNLSLPLFHGLVSLGFIAVFNCIVARLFDIRDRGMRLALCGLTVSFPVVTSTLGYMFTAPYYFLALALSGAAVFVVRERTGAIRFLAGAACICCSLGIYQSYFAVTASLIVLRLIFDISADRLAAPAGLARRIAHDLGMCVLGFALYYGVWQVSMKVLGLTPSSYQGISAIGQSGLKSLLQSVLTAYRRFFLVFKLPEENLYPMGIRYVQMIAVALSVVCGVALVVETAKKSVARAAFQALLIALLPVCFNLIYIMIATSPDAWIHTLMLYGQAMLYVFLICALPRVFARREKIAKALKCVAAAALGLLILMNTYYDNACYDKAAVMQQQQISDLTVLVSRIKSVEGYRDTMPVCFVMTGQRDATLTRNRWFSDLNLVPFASISPYHNERNLSDMLQYWCAFSPEYAPASQFKKLPEVKAMPDYPDDGSIRIIDDTVVVKW